MNDDEKRDFARRLIHAVCCDLVEDSLAAEVDDNPDFVQYVVDSISDTAEAFLDCEQFIGTPEEPLNGDFGTGFDLLHKDALRAGIMFRVPQRGLC